MNEEEAIALLVAEGHDPEVVTRLVAREAEDGWIQAEEVEDLRGAPEDTPIEVCTYGSSRCPARCEGGGMTYTPSDDEARACYDIGRLIGDADDGDHDAEFGRWQARIRAEGVRDALDHCVDSALFDEQTRSILLDELESL